MTGLSHRRVLTHINALLDEALDPVEADAIKQHLQTCPACAAEVETWSRLRAAVKHAYAPAPAPPDLVIRVRAELRRLGEETGAAA